MEPFETPTPIVGEAVAGEAAATLKQINKLVKGMATNTFDLAELLHKAKSNKYYAPKYNTFGEYAKTLDLKVAKAYYLAKMVEVMTESGVPRHDYEPLGIAKLRLIIRIETEKEFGGKPNTEWVKSLVHDGVNMTPQEIDTQVNKIQGLIGLDSIEWVNFPIKQSAKAFWEQAVELAKKQIGSVGQDDDGNFKDASVGRCAEVIALSYLQDLNNWPEGTKIDTVGSNTNANTTNDTLPSGDSQLD